MIGAQKLLKICCTPSIGWLFGLGLGLGWLGWGGLAIVTNIRQRGLLARAAVALA